MALELRDAVRTTFFSITSIVENRFIESKDTYACFIDFRKAFDSVDRPLLWRKLRDRYGIKGNFLAAIQALYKDVQCSVSINQASTDWFSISSGVKQGCIYSPLPYLRYLLMT